MEFSVKSVHKIESDVKIALKSVKLDTVENLNHSLLSKLNKESFVGFVLNVSRILNESVDLCNRAAESIDELKTERISNQKKIIDLQQVHIVTASVQDSLKETVKTT